MKEIVVDSFAGGGGASTGIEMALGFSPDIAINHDAEAIAMHRRNHPETYHLVTNVWKVDPYAVAQGRPVGLLWASPDCKDFSKAKGGKPVRKNIRDLAWVVVGWARTVAPRIIMLENVEEFQDWGPLLADGSRCPDRRGKTFKRFVNELRRLGYKVEWRELVAADYGSPTTRKRLFIIARRDGLPIVWEKPSHGRPDSLRVKNGKQQPWRTAAECIDWTLPCYSIFITKNEASAMRRKCAIAIAAFCPSVNGPGGNTSSADAPPACAALAIRAASRLPSAHTPCTIGSRSPTSSAAISMTRRCSSKVQDATSVECAFTVMADRPSVAAMWRRWARKLLSSMARSSSNGSSTAGMTPAGM